MWTEDRENEERRRRQKEREQWEKERERGKGKMPMRDWRMGDVRGKFVPIRLSLRVKCFILYLAVRARMLTD